MSVGQEDASWHSPASPSGTRSPSEHTRRTQGLQGAVVPSVLTAPSGWTQSRGSYRPQKHGCPQSTVAPSLGRQHGAPCSPAQWHPAPQCHDFSSPISRHRACVSNQLSCWLQGKWKTPGPPVGPPCALQAGHSLSHHRVTIYSPSTGPRRARAWSEEGWWGPHWA